MMIYIFIGASIAFWLGVAADARSSQGMMERTQLFRDAAGRFSLRRYVLTMAGMFGVALVTVLIGQSAVSTVAASAVLIFGAVIRFRIAAKNRKLRRQ